MKIKLTKERCLRLAQLEGDHTISAGDMTTPTNQQKPSMKTRIIKWCQWWTTPMKDFTGTYPPPWKQALLIICTGWFVYPLVFLFILFPPRMFPSKNTETWCEKFWRWTGL